MGYIFTLMHIALVCVSGAKTSKPQILCVFEIPHKLLQQKAFLCSSVADLFQII